MDQLIPNQTIQDYLKHIYNLTQNGQPANTNTLAERLDLRPGTVSEMINKMAKLEPPLVDHQKYQGVRLTPAGGKMALKVIRRHRLIETFLVKVLGYSWDMVHEEACRMEHIVSDEFEARIASMLGEPSHSPHGEPIPTSALAMPPFYEHTLASLTTGQYATILQVPDSDPGLLRYLSSIGFTPGSKVTVLNHSPFDGNLMVTVNDGNASHVVGLPITSKIYVKKMDS